jgi:hypothetical protein
MIQRKYLATTSTDPMGCPFYSTNEANIIANLEHYLPITNRDEFNELHAAFRDIVPHKDPTEHCYVRCGWILHIASKLGLDVGSIKTRSDHPVIKNIYPHIEGENLFLSWKYHVAPVIFLRESGCLRTTTTPYILDMLLPNVHTEAEWYAALNLKKTSLDIGPTKQQNEVFQNDLEYGIRPRLISTYLDEQEPDGITVNQRIKQFLRKPRIHTIDSSSKSF